MFLYGLLFCGFAALALASTLAVRLGCRGEGCDRSLGYDVPAEVRADPALGRRANELVVFWGTGLALLSLAPLVPLGLILLDGGDRSLSTWGLAAFAAYGFLLAVLGGYPFERIRRLHLENRP